MLQLMHLPECVCAFVFLLRVCVLVCVCWGSCGFSLFSRHLIEWISIAMCTSPFVSFCSPLSAAFTCIPFCCIRCHNASSMSSNLYTMVNIWEIMFLSMPKEKSTYILDTNVWVEPSGEKLYGLIDCENSDLKLLCSFFLVRVTIKYANVPPTSPGISSMNMESWILIHWELSSSTHCH